MVIFSQKMHLMNPGVPEGCEMGAASKRVSQSTVGRSDEERWRPKINDN